MLVMVRLAFGGHLPDDATQQKLVASLSLPNLVGLAAGQGGLSAQLRGELDVVLVLVSFGLIAVDVADARVGDGVARGRWCC